MAVLTGSGFYLSTALGVGGAAANGTVISASDLGNQVFDIQTDGTNAGNNQTMNTGDSVIVDTDSDGSFADETSTTQTDNDRYVNSIITYSDGSTSSATLELITLSDGSQVMLLQDGYINNINTASGSISSITLGTFNSQFNNIYNQANFNNTITNTVVCFEENSQIMVEGGERPVKDIKIGDRVLTADNGMKKVRWIGRRTVSSKELIDHPNLRPILIKSGALGKGLPNEDLILSPQHRVLLASQVIKRMFRVSEILVPAVKLLDLKGVNRISTCEPVTYVHILFDEHQIVFANGAPTESMFAGAEALKSLSPESRNEIYQVFPSLAEDVYHIKAARKFVDKNSDIDDMIYRHFKNSKALIEVKPAWMNKVNRCATKVGSLQ